MRTSHVEVWVTGITLPSTEQLFHGGAGIVAIVEETTDHNGAWYKANAGRGTSVFMHRYKLEQSAPVSFYWHGRTSLAEIENFVRPQFSSRRVDSTKVIIYTDRQRFQIETEHYLLRQIVPGDARFVRVECFDTKTDDAHRPIFIVWARLDLTKVPYDETAPDEIGIHFSANLLPLFSDALIPFISDTQVPAPLRSDVDDCVQALAENFAPNVGLSYL